MRYETKTQTWASPELAYWSYSLLLGPGSTIRGFFGVTAIFIFGVIVFVALAFRFRIEADRLKYPKPTYVLDRI